MPYDSNFTSPAPHTGQQKDERAERRNAGAEPLLLSGYGGIKRKENNLGARPNGFTKGIQNLVQLYEATCQCDKAAEWKHKLC